MLHRLRTFLIPKDIKIKNVVHKLQRFCCVHGFYLLVELHTLLSFFYDDLKQMKKKINVNITRQANFME